MTNKKGQGAVDYLIVLSIFLIIGFIVVGLMGGFPGVSGIKPMDTKVFDYQLKNSSYLDEVCKERTTHGKQYTGKRVYFNVTGETYYLICLEKELKELNIRKQVVIP